MFDVEQLRRSSRDPFMSHEIGKAAEHLVCADLIMQGHRAFVVAAGLPYDVMVDVDGRPLRVQVKAACFPGNINTKGTTERLGYTFGNYIFDSPIIPG